MTCRPFRAFDGEIRGFLCTTQRPAPRCEACNERTSTILCDGTRQGSMIPCNRELCEECAIDVPIGLRTPAELMATIGRRLDDDFHFCEPCFRTQTGKNVPVEVTP